MNESPKQQIAFFEEEVKDILGKPPRYLVKWGITLYLLLFCLVIILSATINYPVYTQCEAEITPMNTAQYVVLSKSNVLQNLNVKDGSIIQEGHSIFSVNGIQVTSKLEGKVRLLKPLSDGYTSTNPDTILQINPVFQDYKLTLKIPSSHIDKIKVDQRISFQIDSKIIDGSITSIPANKATDGYFYVEAISDSNQTFISSPQNIPVDILIDNKKIFNKILNL